MIGCVLSLTESNALFVGVSLYLSYTHTRTRPACLSHTHYTIRTHCAALQYRYVLDNISDQTGMKGTGRWGVQEAAERSVPAPTIAAALDAR